MLRPANVLGDTSPSENEFSPERCHPESAAADEGSLFV